MTDHPAGSNLAEGTDTVGVEPIVDGARILIYRREEDKAYVTAAHINVGGVALLGDEHGVPPNIEDFVEEVLDDMSDTITRTIVSLVECGDVPEHDLFVMALAMIMESHPLLTANMFANILTEMVQDAKTDPEFMALIAQSRESGASNGEPENG